MSYRKPSPMSNCGLPDVPAECDEFWRGFFEMSGIGALIAQRIKASMKSTTANQIKIIKNQTTEIHQVEGTNHVRFRRDFDNLTQEAAVHVRLDRTDVQRKTRKYFVPGVPEPVACGSTG